MDNRTLFLHHLAQTSPAPLGLDILRAEGVFLYDRQGKKYLDLIAGIGVSALGHRHPRVVQAIQEQADTYLHTLVYGEFVLSPQVGLASLLARQLPPNLSSIYLVNSGAEATEGAIKLARKWTGKQEIIAARWAYHGSTLGAASLMNPTTLTQPFAPLLPGISHIDFNCIHCLDRIGPDTAAVIIEPVQAEAGVRLPWGDYLTHLAAKCRSTGTLLLFDEIQTGMGRTGSLFAFQQFGVVPDVLLLAKGLGGGMPLGAFISSREIMACLADNPALSHITTFGGHPVSCAAALANLQVLLEDDYVAQVPEKARRFRENLNHPAVREIRSAGLLMAVDLDDERMVQQVIAHALTEGLIADWFLFNGRALRIAPPLTISFEEIDLACTIIRRSLDAAKP